MEDKKAQIHDCAKELFSLNGFKDTNVAQITKKAGMAVGTFYLYYPSKEKLFMEILLEENTKMNQHMFASLDLTQDPLTVIRHTLALNVSGMKANPILREWYNKAVFDKIEQVYREENGIDAIDFLYDSFLTLVEQWQAEGKMRRDIDSKMIMMLFAAIINIDTHKEEIGLEYFPMLLEIMTELVVTSLTDVSE